MANVRIPVSEFLVRVQRMREKMISRGLDALIVYGDEYRKENLRYASNYWPIFERGAILLAKPANRSSCARPRANRLRGR